MCQIAKAVFFDITWGNRVKRIFSLLVFISSSINKRHFACSKHCRAITSIIFFFDPTKKQQVSFAILTDEL